MGLRESVSNKRVSEPEVRNVRVRCSGIGGVVRKKGKWVSWKVVFIV